MSSSDVTATSPTITAEIAQARDDVWDMLARAGTWWTAPERLAIAERARAAFARRTMPPWMRDLSSAVADLPADVPAIIDCVTLDAGRIDAAWAAMAIDALGEGAYVELVALVAVVVMADIHAEAVGVDLTPLPDPLPGEPSRVRPHGLGDIGAHVSVLDPFPFANVARALSAVPDANTMFRTLSVPAYSAPGFAELTWDTPLSRPQVELIASRVAAINDCFY